MRRGVSLKPAMVEPQVGQIRRVRKFLWWPTTLPRQDGKLEWRWFEVVEIEQVYSFGGSATDIAPRYGWFSKKWLN